MVAVRINGETSGITGEGVTRLTDLIELIKASIDPDHMITDIKVDGRELEESEWFANVAQFGTAIIEVDTSTPAQFVRERLSTAAEVVDNCYQQFRGARKAFKNADWQGGNQRLLGASTTMSAFFDWYGTMLELVPPEKKPNYDINPQVNEIIDVCKRICQQQLYQSWWALGETIENELEPKLDQLEDFCSKMQW